MALFGTLHVFLLLIAPGPIGLAVVRLTSRIASKDSDLSVSEIHLSLAYCIGLVFYLLVAFFLKLVGAPWWLASYLPLVILVLDKESLSVVPKQLAPDLNLNFLLWFFVIVSIGISLCSSLDGIHTAWVNNYGDLAFHLGIISSFVFGDNFPPEYHIFVGERLSYPFFINFWTALLWWPYSEWNMLSVIFTLQWSVVWFLIYHLLSGRRYVVMPWAVLLAGGSYELLGKMSTDFLRDGYPWSVFISTIWIPQRTFMLGLCCLLAALWLAYKGFRKDRSTLLFDANPSEQFARLLLLSLVLSIAFICHGHSALIASMFLGVVYLGRVARNFFAKDSNYSSALMISPKALTSAALLFAVILLLISPWLLGKAGIVQPIAGWTGGKSTTVGIDRIQEAAGMWLHNAPQVLLLVAGVLFICGFYSEVLACMALFLLFNFVQIAAWEWDQIKLFVSLYCILLALWSFSKARLAYYSHFVLVILLVPAAVECYQIFQKGPIFTVYSQEKLKEAQGIKELLSVDAVVAASPQHNSAATISGRAMFMGYPGTLWSHSLDYGSREVVQKSLAKLVACSEEVNDMPCPDYLLWDVHAKQYWNQSSPRLAGIQPTDKPFLYKIGVQ